MNRKGLICSAITSLAWLFMGVDNFIVGGGGGGGGGGGDLCCHTQLTNFNITGLPLWQWCYKNKLLTEWLVPFGKNESIILRAYAPINVMPHLPQVTEFQHRFNTETLILLHLAYTFGIHLYSTLLLCLHGFIAYLCFFNSFLLACSYVHTFSYVVLDTTVTKMQILTLLEVCLDLFNHKNA